jgi:hypothetical protein
MHDTRSRSGQCGVLLPLCDRLAMQKQLLVYLKCIAGRKEAHELEILIRSDR